MRRIAAAATVVFLSIVPAPAAAQGPGGAPLLRPPVDGAIGRHFEAPGTDWGPGHRGLDYLVPAGTRVAAAADGVVSWAGPVAGMGAVTVDHGGGFETTYSSLGVAVAAGQVVDAGSWLGTTGLTHPGGRPGLHFGVKRGGEYVDPRLYLVPPDVAGAIHLAPVVGWPSEAVPEWLRPSADRAGTGARPCAPVAEIAAVPPPPSDNIAVAIAGIGSKTAGGVGAEMYESGPELLGYPPHRVYRFSYAGVDSDDLHVPYERVDSFRDLVAAAGRLEELLIEIARRHPGRDVDLIAHSQGGIVARIYLEHAAESGRAGLPHVDHLVTFATPHRGAPAAQTIRLLDDGTFTGGSLLDAASWLARRGLPVPDPRSPAALQLASGSSLVEWLATEDLPFGTRALALAVPDDVVVPVPDAAYEGETTRVLPPAIGWAHGDIVSSGAARALAYAFLRDAPVSCPGAWDEWGRYGGGVIGWLTRRIPPVYLRFELRVLIALLGL